MGPIEIITIIVCVLIVGGVIGSYVYKKLTGKPTGGCGCGCSGCSGCSSCSSCKDNTLEDAIKEIKDIQEAETKDVPQDTPQDTPDAN